MELIKYLREHCDDFGTVYYPGAGKDYSPLELFSEHTEVKEIFYSDYGEEIRQLGLVSATNPKDIEDDTPFFNYRVQKLQALTPRDFGKSYWGEFWPQNPVSHNFGKPENAWGIKVQMINIWQDIFTFTYLGTEGIQTASVLLENKIIPDVLVLQDHGFGGNWSVFGGADSLLYRAMQQNLPIYILAEPNSNTEMWPGYEQITDTWLPDELGGEPLHNNPRALFRKAM